MKIEIFGVEEKSFKDKKDGTDIIYYRAYGHKPTKREKGKGGVYCEVKINKDCFNALYNEDLDEGSIVCEFDFDENGRVTDWVIL